MRHEPARIGRIAGEAAAQMVVDAALAHRRERLVDGVAIGRLAAALPGPPQEFEDAGLRKFRGGADAAVDRIALAQQPLGDAVEKFDADALALLRLGEP